MISFNPKARFLEQTKLASAHRDLVATNGFRTAVELSLLQYQRKLALEASADPIIASAQAQRLSGAYQFIDILLNLGEIAEPPSKRPDTGTLVKT